MLFGTYNQDFYSLSKLSPNPHAPPPPPHCIQSIFYEAFQIKFHKMQNDIPTVYISEIHCCIVKSSNLLHDYSCCFVKINYAHYRHYTHYISPYMTFIRIKEPFQTCRLDSRASSCDSIKLSMISIQSKSKEKQELILSSIANYTFK